MNKKPRKPRNFYSNALDDAERLELKAAASLDGIDDEIALIRFHIKQLAKTTDHDELARCTNALCRALVTRYAISKHDKKGLKEAMNNVLRDIVLPLGFNKNEVSVSLLKK